MLSNYAYGPSWRSRCTPPASSIADAVIILDRLSSIREKPRDRSVGGFFGLSITHDCLPDVAIAQSTCLEHVFPDVRKVRSATLDQMHPEIVTPIAGVCTTPHDHVLAQGRQFMGCDSSPGLFARGVDQPHTQCFFFCIFVGISCRWISNGFEKDLNKSSDKALLLDQ